MPEVSNTDILEDLGEFARSTDKDDMVLPEPIDVKVEASAKKPFESQEDLAERVVKADGVRFISDLKAYMVEGIRGKAYSVKLHPKEECHCPSTATCYHIMAAKLFIGMSIKSEKEEKKISKFDEVQKQTKVTEKNWSEKAKKLWLWTDPRSRFKTSHWNYTQQFPCFYTASQ